MGKTVGLLERSPNKAGLLDMVLAFKAFAANRMHHPELLRQLVDAEGPRKLVGLLGIGGDGGDIGGDATACLRCSGSSARWAARRSTTRLAARRGCRSSAAAAARPVG